MTLNKDQHRLFVEGPSDGAVINKLIKRRLDVDIGAAKIIQTKSEGAGFDWVYGQVKAALVNQKLRRFGAVVDRDVIDGKPDRWLPMRALLESHGIQAELRPEGVIAETDWGGQFGLWLMPNNLDPGDLETFLEGLIPEAAADWTWADQAVRQARAKGAPYRDPHTRKARFHTWLAWRDPPGNPYGTAIEATQLGDRSTDADAFVAWFEALFVTE